MKLLQAAYHRNGVCGAPFYAVLFEDEGRKMLATVFAEVRHVAVICADLIEIDGVTFGVNSWRGDTYERWLRSEIAKLDDPQSDFMATWLDYSGVTA